MLNLVSDLSWPVRVDSEWAELTSKEVFEGKRVVLFALPGAFTPTCSNYQLPGYDELYDEFKAHGIDEVYCLSVNDTFVMNAWAKDLGIKNVKLIPDGSAKFTHSMNMLVAKDNLGFGIRSWRYAMVVNNGEVEKLFEEPGKSANHPEDPYEVSDPQTVLTYLKGGRHIELTLNDTADIKERIGK
jgi:peroxiredoxin